jgi:signal transduction histidine kinase
MTRIQTALTVLAFLAVAFLSGLVVTLDGLLDAYRFGIDKRPVSGDVVIVEIDAKSLEEIGVWPWPRRLHGEVLDRLTAAGAGQVAFDIDFSQASDPENDAALEAALRRAGGATILPAFLQLSSTGTVDRHVVLTRPIRQFAAQAWTGLVNADVDSRGTVRGVFSGIDYEGDYYPAFAELLAGTTWSASRRIGVDFSIDAASLPSISFSDVLSGRADLTALAGKTVIVGATAIELRDQVTIPGYAILSGPALQALATESLIQNRVVRFGGPIPQAAGLVAIILFFSFAAPIPRWRRKRGHVLLFIPAIELVAFALQHQFAVALPTAAWHLALLVYYGLATIRELSVRALTAALAKAKNQDTEQILGQIMDDSFDGVIIAEPDGSILACNPAGYSIIFDAPPVEDLTGCHLGDSLPTAFADAVLPALQEATQRSGAAAIREVEVGNGDNSKYVELTATRSDLTGDGPRTLITLTFRDVTARRQAELLAQVSAREAIAANQAKSNFLASISHELRTPLNAIIGFSEVITTMGRERMPEEFLEYCQHINESGHSLLAMVNELIDISRIETGSYELNEERFDVNNFCSTIVRTIAGWPQAEGRHVIIRSDQDAPQLHADKRLVRQMILNLVSNALKFTDDGGRIELRTNLLPSGDLEIVVADDGIGIDAEALDQVTRPFFQSDADLARNHDGAGLGLAIVNGYIGAHDGHVVIDSTKGAGTTVQLIFPPERVFMPDRLPTEKSAAA